ALAERDKQVWVDRAKIEPAADWAKRITRGIEGSKSFIFIMTPESVISPECRSELETATQYHKLIIPVVFKEVDRQGLPDSLSKPNWIVFGPDHNTERVFGEVNEALEADLPWRDAHTRLAVRAQEWAHSPRD